MNKLDLINAIEKLYDDNLILTQRNIDLNTENTMLKEKNRKLIQGNKTKQSLIDELEKKVHELERKKIKEKSISKINEIKNSSKL